VVAVNAVGVNGERSCFEPDAGELCYCAAAVFNAERDEARWLAGALLDVPLFDKHLEDGAPAFGEHAGELKIFHRVRARADALVELVMFAGPARQSLRGWYADEDVPDRCTQCLG